MNKLHSLKDSHLKKDDSHEEKKYTNQSNARLEKVLCNHCKRTAINGIRCLGICVADNEY